MGVDPSSLSFEHFDFLKDLERARSNLEIRIEEKDPSGNEQEADLPLKETKLIAWQFDEFDDEGFKLVLSRKKKKSTKKGKKCMTPPPNLKMGVK